MTDISFRLVGKRVSTLDTIREATMLPEDPSAAHICPCKFSLGFLRFDIRQVLVNIFSTESCRLPDIYLKKWPYFLKQFPTFNKILF